MARGIDHVVVGVDDLDAAAAAWTSAGFTVCPRGIHPWGTHNRIIQFRDRSFIELITVGEPERIVGHGAGFSFGAFVRDRLRVGEGASMLVLRSDDADADLADWASKGLEVYARFDFAREAVRPDGTRRPVGFHLAFTRDPLSPYAGFFTCRQTHPENFWNPDVQVHDNGALGIAEVDLVAGDPADHHVFLQAFAGVRDVTMTSARLTLSVPGATIAVHSPDAARMMLGVEPPANDGLSIVALAFTGARLTPRTLRGLALRSA